MALRAMNQGSDEPSLARIIERSAELKRTLVDFALSPRMERHLERFMVEGTGSHEVQLRVQLTALEGKRVALLAELAEQADRPA